MVAKSNVKMLVQNRISSNTFRLSSGSYIVGVCQVVSVLASCRVPLAY